MIYLDNAATTEVLPEVFLGMIPFIRGGFGNPDSPHALGRKSAYAIEKARESVSRFIGANGSGALIFTSGGTESNNMVFGSASNSPVAMNVITSATEHKSVLEPARSSRVNSVRIIKPGSKGYISKDDIARIEIPAFTIVSLMHMNNETGMMNDINAIGEYLKQFRDIGVFFHVDCVQSAGAIQIDVKKMNADMVSISSHKIHGPKGVGCLWVSDRVLDYTDCGRSLGIIRGGGQENGMRAGTSNVPGIVGFGIACESASETPETYNRIADIFKNSLKDYCGELNIDYHINLFDNRFHCNKILSITFPGADSETVVLNASRGGLCISAGAACNSELSEPSYVLTSSGISEDDARCTVRISFSNLNSYVDAIDGARILAETVRNVLDLNLVGE